MSTTASRAVPWDFSETPRAREPYEIPTGKCSRCDERAVMYNWDWDSWSWPQVCNAHVIWECTGCGTPRSSDETRASGCQNCLPTVCPDCGGINHLATNRDCSCWISLDDMPLADVKAIFAADGTFNIGTSGEVTL